MSEKLTFKPVFVQNQNTKHFGVMMDLLFEDTGDGRFGAAEGQAGWGKTRTTQHWHAHNPSIYLRMRQVWASSHLGFLQAMLKELGDKEPPYSTDRCFTRLMDMLSGNPLPLFLDEVDRLPDKFIDLIRDLTDLTTAPVILIGEEGLTSLLRANRRVWSRVAGMVEFKPLEMHDVVIYARKVTDEKMKLDQEVAAIIHKATDGRSLPGNYRVVKRTILTLIQMANAESGPDGPGPITPEMAKIAVSTALTGR